MAGLLSAHFDLDAFFASVEEKHHGVTGRPLVVGGTNGAGARGAVTSANQAARRLGIKAGESIERVTRIHGSRVMVCPVRMSLYVTESQAVMELLASCGVPMQQMSIDEASLDLRGVRDGLDTEWAGVRFCERLRRSVRTECGLAISVGVSRGRVTAKMAVEEAKPDGLRAIDAAELAEWFPRQSLAAIPGIGPVAKAALERRGIHTVGDAASVGRHVLISLLGEGRGAWLWGIVEGSGDVPDLTGPVAKRSIGAESTLPTSAHSPSEVDALVDGLSADVCGRLLESGTYASGVRVTIRTQSGSVHSRQRRIDATRNYTVVRALVRELLEDLWGGRSVRLVGVAVYDITEHRVEKLFDEEIESKGSGVGEMWCHPTLGEGLVVRRDGTIWTVSFPDRRRVIDVGQLQRGV